MNLLDNEKNEINYILRELEKNISNQEDEAIKNKYIDLKSQYYRQRESQNTLAKIVEKQVIAQHSKIDGELTAKVLLLPFKNMIIPEGKMTVDVECSDTNFSPKKYVNIVIKVDNNVIEDASNG